MLITIKRQSHRIFNNVLTTELSGNSCDQCIQFEHSSEEDEPYLNVNLLEEDKKFFKIEWKESENRERLVVVPGWSAGLYRVVLREFHVDCCYTAKYAKVASDSEISMFCYCNECESELEARSSGNISRLDIKMTKGVKDHTFESRRRMTKIEKEEFSRKLTTDYAFNVLNETVYEEVTKKGLQTTLPRNIPSQGALRTLRSRTKTDTSDTCLKSLVKMKLEDSEFTNVIQSISVIPFKIIFWSEFQKFYYAQVCKTEKVRIGIDSSGRCAQSNALIAGMDINRQIKMPHVMFYVIVVKRRNGKSLPVGAMLSADQHYIQVESFVKQWHADFSRPHEVGIDGSAVLLKVSVTSFTSCGTVEEYLRKSFLALEKNSKADLPECYIRLDANHFVKSLHRSGIFAKHTPEFKYFYLCLLGFIMQCESLEDIKLTVRDMLVVARNQCCGKLQDGTILPTEEATKRLKQIINTHNADFLHEEFEKCEKTSNENIELIDEDTEKDSTSSDHKATTTNIPWFDDFLATIKHKTFSPKQVTLDMSYNCYYSENVEIFLRRHLERLVLWSAVMRPLYESDSEFGNTSDVESVMNLVKNIILHDVHLPMRPDLFVKKFTRSVTAQTQREYSELNKVIILFPHCMFVVLHFFVTSIFVFDLFSDAY